MAAVSAGQNVPHGNDVEERRGLAVNHVRNHKPLALKWPFLLPVGLYICGLIALLEYSSRVFPVAENRRDIPTDSSSEFGPFISVPLVNAIATSTPSALSSSSSTWADVTQPTGTSISRPSNASSTTPSVPVFTNWGNLTLQPVQLGNRVGIPVKYFNQSNQTSALVKRVPPPDQFGQIPGPPQLIEFAVRLIEPEVYEGRKWVMVQILYFPLDFSNLRVSSIEGLCQVQCDGPAIVFLNPRCWQDWIAASEEEKQKALERPDYERRTSEQGLGGGKKCPAPKPPEAQTTTASIPAEIVGVTTINGGPSTFTTSSRIPIVATIAPGQILAPQTTILTNAAGQPSATSILSKLTTMTFRDAQGNSTATVTARLKFAPTVLTLNDAQGHPTATITTEVPLEPTSITLKDAQGRPTATITTDVPLIGGPITLTDSNGMPIATITKDLPTLTKSGMPPARSGNFDDTWMNSGMNPKNFHPVSWGEYFLAAFFPVLITIPLTALTQMINSEVKTLLPFHALTRPMGAEAAQSVCMTTGGLIGFYNSFQLLFSQKEPLSFLADLLVLSSAVVVSFSSEAVGIKLLGSCTNNDFNGCHMGVALFRSPSRVVEAFLALMLVLIAVLYVLLRRWESGYGKSGRSIASLASLLNCEDTRVIFRSIRPHEPNVRISNDEMAQQLQGRLFHLGHFGVPNSPDYGLLSQPSTHTSKTSKAGSKSKFPGSNAFSHRPPVDYISQSTFLLLLSGFLILIVYYESTHLDTPFERFMDSQDIGVRVIFTGLGVIISLFWDFHFCRVCITEPYRRLARQSQVAKNSILVSPSTTAFSGLPAAIRERDFYIAMVAFAAVLSKVMPILLANVPFSPWLTWPTHSGCTWTAVGILAVMILTLMIGVGFVKYPFMPVDPATLAGSLYYICDSTLLRDVGGVSTASNGQPVQLSSRRRYSFGKMIGLSGETRIGVDYAHVNPA